MEERAGIRGQLTYGATSPIYRSSAHANGVSDYVMSLAINPKDTNTFASACLDRTVKIWSLGSSTPNFQLEAHETKGVNHVDYYPHSDKPYLLTTSDDVSYVDICRRIGLLS